MHALATERLRLRAVAQRDVAAIVEGCSDPCVSRYIPVIPSPYGEQDALAWLATAPQRAQTAQEHSLAIATAADADELLGIVTVRLRDGGSIGYWLRASHRGRGLMSEAVAAVADSAINEYGVKGLCITTHPDNVASQRVAERAGFVQTGIVDHEPPFRDGVRQAVRFERSSR